MSAYVIARIEVRDPEQYEEYKKLSPAAVAAFGGEFVARGGRVETLEGPEETRRMVVVRFDSAEQARAFYHSGQYLHAKSRREGAATAQFVLVEGL